MSGAPGAPLVPATTVSELQMIVYRPPNPDRRYVLVYDVAPLQSFNPTVQQAGGSSSQGSNGASGVTYEAGYTSDQANTVDQPTRRVDVHTGGGTAAQAPSGTVAVRPTGSALRPAHAIRYYSGGPPRRAFQTEAARRQFYVGSTSRAAVRNPPIFLYRRRVQQRPCGAIMMMYRSLHEQ